MALPRSPERPFREVAAEIAEPPVVGRPGRLDQLPDLAALSAHVDVLRAAGEGVGPARGKRPLREAAELQRIPERAGVDPRIQDDAAHVEHAVAVGAVTGNVDRRPLDAAVDRRAIVAEAGFLAVENA